MDKFGNKFGTSFQIKIISSLLADRIFLQQVYDIIKPEMFDSEAHEWIVTKTLSHFLQIYCISSSSRKPLQ